RERTSQGLLGHGRRWLPGVLPRILKPVAGDGKTPGRRPAPAASLTSPGGLARIKTPRAAPPRGAARRIHGVGRTMELRSTGWLPRAGNGSGPAHTPFGFGRVRYFKRFRMEVDLDDFLPRPALPEGYQWLPWDAALLESHADALFAS